MEMAFRMQCSSECIFLIAVEMTLMFGTPYDADVGEKLIFHVAEYS